MANCLVTGGAGFIASHLVDHLIQQNHTVTIIDNLSSTSNTNNINKNATFIHDDILNKKVLENVFQKNNIEIIFHLAAIPSVQRSIAEPEFTYKTNVEGTHNLLLMAKEYNVPKFIFASSSSVYGEQATLPQVETMRGNPLSPYALHKLICEQMCTLYYKLYGIKTVSLRFFNVFGPRQNPNGEYACLIPKAVEALKSGKEFTIFGNGKNRRDFIYVDDVIGAMISTTFSENEKLFGEVINVGSGVSYSVRAVVKIIQEILGNNSEIKHSEPVIEPKETLASTLKMEELLGYKTKIGFEEGVKRTIIF